MELDTEEIARLERRHEVAPVAAGGRYVGWICGAEHIRETIPFPRMLERFRP